MAEGKLNSKGERETFFELNGQMRSMFILDQEASKDIVVRPKAMPGIKGQIGAPMPGDVRRTSFYDTIFGVKNRI